MTFACDGCTLDWLTEQNGGRLVAKGEVRCVNGVFDRPGDNIHGPSGQYSAGGFGGFTEENPTNVVDPPEGSGWDPAPRATPPVPAGKTGQQTAGKKKADKSSDAALTWQQRALQLLSKLQTAKGFKELPPKLKAEVTALIDDAPNDAYS